MPAAPGLFSTITGWPQRSDSFCAISRAPVSVPPPGGNGTTRVTERVGYGAWARAATGGPARIVTSARATFAIRMDVFRLLLRRGSAFLLEGLLALLADRG